MSLIWWVLPAVTLIFGLMLSFAGLGKLMKLNLVSGGLRFLFGIGFLGVTGVVTLAGLNLQTYERLTFERVVATISFETAQDAEDAYVATLVLTDDDRRSHKIRGDEFSIGAQVITFKPMSQMLGYDSVYRLDYLEGRYADRFNSEAVSEAISTGIKLFENPGLDVYGLAKQQGERFGVSTGTKDAQFGSAVYAPMADGLEYEVSMTQSALVIRPKNEAARERLALPPGG
ncbi:MAG: hypothetical protein AAF296_11965 [Pseudomonadota bacterium]